MFKNIKKLSALTAAMVVVAASTPAFASVSGVVNVVSTAHSTDFNGSAGEFSIYAANSQTYYADPGTSPGCGLVAPSAEAVKLWASYAQASLLSGKKINIGYNDCDGYHWISSVSIEANQ